MKITVTNAFIAKLAGELTLPDVSQLTAGIDDNGLLLITAHWHGNKVKVFVEIDGEDGSLVFDLHGVSSAKLNVGIPGGLVKHILEHLPQPAWGQTGLLTWQIPGLRKAAGYGKNNPPHNLELAAELAALGPAIVIETEEA